MVWVNDGPVQPSELNFNFPGGGNYTNPTSLNQAANALQELAILHNTLLAKQQLIASGTGNNPDAQLPTYVVQRPWIEPPLGSIPFDTQLVVGMPAVAAAAVAIVTLVVPVGY